MSRIWTLLFFVSIAGSMSGQCAWPDSVSRRYELTVWKAVYEKGYAGSETEITGSTFLPADSMKLLLKLMGCIYNDTGSTRDSIFTSTAFERIIYTQYESDVYSVYFQALVGTPFADSWYLGKPTGISALENKIRNDSLSISIKKQDPNYYTGKVSSSKALNTQLLVDSLELLTASPYFFAYASMGDGNFLRWRRSNDTMRLIFGYRWGDCFSGCMYYKYVTYLFVKDKKQGPFFADNIPDLPPGPHYLTSISGKKNYWNCNLKAPLFYYPQISDPYVFYAGKPWGKWYVNGEDQTLKMAQEGRLILNGNGIFQIRHVPLDSLGVWYNDTIRVTAYTTPDASLLASDDTARLCAKYDAGMDANVQLPAYFHQWFQDSVNQETWNYQISGTINPTNQVNRVFLHAVSAQSACGIYDTFTYTARFYPAAISRVVPQECLHTPQRIIPQYPVSAVKCNGVDGDSFCSWFAPSVNVMSYEYQGCQVKETIEIIPGNPRRIKLQDTYRISGHDSLILDAGAGWKSVFWNHQPGDRYYTFKGRNMLFTDTIHLRCVDSGDCFDTLLIRMEQEKSNAVFRERKTAGKIYPVPASDELFIPEAYAGNWVIYNLQGRLIYNGTGPGKIDLRYWSAGLYYFNYEGEWPQKFEVVK